MSTTSNKPDVLLVISQMAATIFSSYHNRSYALCVDDAIELYLEANKQLKTVQVS